MLKNGISSVSINNNIEEENEDHCKDLLDLLELAINRMNSKLK
jgi:hypothetical protein